MEKNITIPILKKGDKNSPEIYRGTTLLSSNMKLPKKIIDPVISKHINISEQHGFGKKWSTIDAILIDNY